MLKMNLMNISNVSGQKSPKTIVILFNVVFFETFSTPKLVDEFITNNIRETDALCGLTRLTSQCPEQRLKFCSYDYVSKHNESDDSLLCESNSIQDLSSNSGVYVAIGLQCAKGDMPDELMFLEKQLNDLVKQKVIKSFTQTS